MPVRQKYIRKAYSYENGTPASAQSRKALKQCRCYIRVRDGLLILLATAREAALEENRYFPYPATKLKVPN
jgi:hypothetical protein